LHIGVFKEFPGFHFFICLWIGASVGGGEGDLFITGGNRNAHCTVFSFFLWVWYSYIAQGLGSGVYLCVFFFLFPFIVFIPDLLYSWELVAVVVVNYRELLCLQCYIVGRPAGPPYGMVAWGGVLLLEVNWFDYLLIPDIRPFTSLILRHWANCVG